MIKINKKNNDTNIYGLIYIPDLEPEISNDQDHLDTSEHLYRPTLEISDRNLKKIESIILNKRHNCKGIMEIGICRNGERSMTHVLLNNKKNDTIYLGVDLEDKSFLNDPEKNIFTIKTNSHNQEEIRLKLNKIGIDKLSLLMIDGWHSVNTVINDWRYADLLDDNGIVIFHDTNTHPGPISILEAIDKNIFEVNKFFTENFDDQGISTAQKR